MLFTQICKNMQRIEILEDLTLSHKIVQIPSRNFEVFDETGFVSLETSYYYLHIFTVDLQFERKKTIKRMFISIMKHALLKHKNATKHNDFMYYLLPLSPHIIYIRTGQRLNNTLITDDIYNTFIILNTKH